MRNLLVLFTLALSPNVHAVPPARDLPPIEDESLNRGDEFLIDTYDAEAHVFRVIYRNDETAGPLFATLQDLAAGVKAIYANRVYLKAHPKDLEHHTAVVDRADQMRVRLKEEIVNSKAKN